MWRGGCFCWTLRINEINAVSYVEGGFFGWTLWINAIKCVRENGDGVGGRLMVLPSPFSPGQNWS